MSLKESQPLLPRNTADKRVRYRFLDFFRSFWRVGFVAFGGSLGHFAIFHEKYVAATDGPTIPEETFIELFAVSIALPGPLGPKLAAALGATFGGLLGAILCFFVFTLPGALLMAFAGVWFHGHLRQPGSEDFIRSIAEHSIGLISAAFGLIVLASYRIAIKTCAESKLGTLICIGTVVLGVLAPSALAPAIFISCLIAGGFIVLFVNKSMSRDELEPQHVGQPPQWNSGIGSVAGIVSLVIFVAINIALIIWWPNDRYSLFVREFWKVGWTVFGGGNVLLPFLLTLVVDSGWIPESVFMSGFGLVGCVPGPFYNIAPFVGGAMFAWRGALMGCLAISMPSLLLMIGILPFWDSLRKVNDVQIFLSGVNASAAGLVIIGVWMLMRRILVGPLAFAISACACTASVAFRCSTPSIVVACGITGALFVTAGVGGPYH